MIAGPRNQDNSRIPKGLAVTKRSAPFVFLGAIVSVLSVLCVPSMESSLLPLLEEKPIPSRSIVQAITFESSDPSFAGEMTMVITFETEGAGTKVTILFKNIPSGIRPEDNEAGTSEGWSRLL